jgi:hypothetical protein
MAGFEVITEVYWTAKPFQVSPVELVDYLR